MNIKKIESLRISPTIIKESWDEDEYVWPSHLPSFIVKVTAADGSHGLGEATSQVWYLGETSSQIADCIDMYDKVLRGVDAENIAECHRRMVAVYSGAAPGSRTARSGVDMALYDLVGKQHGLPVHALLGGAYRTEFDMLTNLYHKTPEAMAQACREFVEAGFKGLKIKVGDRVLSQGWSHANLGSELELLEAALEATPRHVYIDADANQGWWSAAWTISALRQYQQYRNLSIEQPLPYDDIDGAVDIRARSGTPVILDESVWSAEAAMRLVRRGACDRIVLKLNRVGGFFEAQKIVSICEAAGVGVSIDTNPYTLMGDTAVCHIAAICRMPYPVDCEGHQSFLTWDDQSPIRGGITIQNGQARLPDAPGLGVDVDWDILNAHMRAHGAGGTG